MGIANSDQMARAHMHELKVDEENKMLQAEQTHFGDLLVLAGHVDVYRHVIGIK